MSKFSTSVAELTLKAAAAHPAGSSVGTMVHSIGGRSETVTGIVVGHKRGQVVVQTDAHGRIVVPPAKILELLER